MLVVGERINTSRKEIQQAVKQRNGDIIKKEALLQVESGADMIDINCGTEVYNETEIMRWMIELVQEVTDTPLVIDSSNWKTLVDVAKSVKNLGMINSITAEQERLQNILPLAKELNCKVVALTIDETGRLPENAEERVKIVENIINYSLKIGFDVKNLFFDPLVRSVAVEQTQPYEVLKSIEILKKRKLNTICAISNVSYGLPKRKWVNTTFLALCMYNGLDACFVDPTVKEIMLTLKTVDMLLGKDEYCLNYIEFIKTKFFDSTNLV